MFNEQLKMDDWNVGDKYSLRIQVYTFWGAVLSVTLNAMNMHTSDRG